ncbi:MAG: hypothetical protein QNJ51_11580 [Calothrix sp. MO_167.B12]|nr:hypothetical protein [Calothrix sp. MO_167.B12]
MLNQKITGIVCTLAIAASTSGGLIAPIKSYASEGQKIAQLGKRGKGIGYILGVIGTAGTIVDIAVHCYQGGRAGWSPTSREAASQIADIGAVNYLAHRTCRGGARAAKSACRGLGRCRSSKSYKIASSKSYKIAACPRCPVKVMYIRRIY